MTRECRHCHCGIMGWIKCETCNRKLTDQCVVCHNEVAHDIIRNQNLHFVSSPVRRFNMDDPDANGRRDNHE